MTPRLSRLKRLWQSDEPRPSRDLLAYQLELANDEAARQQRRADALANRLSKVMMILDNTLKLLTKVMREPLTECRSEENSALVLKPADEAYTIIVSLVTGRTVMMDSTGEMDPLVFGLAYDAGDRQAMRRFAWLIRDRARNDDDLAEVIDLTAALPQEEAA